MPVPAGPLPTPITVRPDSGTVTRPSTGIIARPDSGLIARPASGTGPDLPGNVQ